MSCRRGKGRGFASVFNSNQVIRNRHDPILPASFVLGSYGSASSAIASPASINYLAVRLKVPPPPPPRRPSGIGRSVGTHREADRRAWKQ
jgi:hypothetical protein